MKTNWRLLLMLALLGGACSRGLDVELPFEGKRLVITARLSAGDSVNVTVDHTYPPTGEFLFTEGVTNARVLLYENDRLLDTLQRTNKNNYTARAGMKPQVGNTYRIRVEAPGYPTLDSQSETIPPFPKVEQLTLKKDGGDYQLVVGIQDIVNQRNQYEIGFTTSYKQWRTVVLINNLSRPDEVVDNCGFRANLNTFYYRDLCFENGLQTTRYGSSLRGTPQGRPPIPLDSLFLRREESNPVAERVVARVRTVNESYLKYQQYSPGEDIGQVFTIPASRFSNVKGGYGLVFCYAERAIVLAVP